MAHDPLGKFDRACNGSNGISVYFSTYDNTLNYYRSKRVLFWVGLGIAEELETAVRSLTMRERIASATALANPERTRNNMGMNCTLDFSAPLIVV